MLECLCGLPMKEWDDYRDNYGNNERVWICGEGHAAIEAEISKEVLYYRYWETLVPEGWYPYEWQPTVQPRMF